MMFTDNTPFHTRWVRLSHQIQSVTDCVNFCNDWLEKLRAVGRARPKGKLVADLLWLECFCLLKTVFTSLPPHQYKCSKMSTFAGLTILDYKSTGEHTDHRERDQLQTDVGFLSARNFLRLSLWKEGKHEKFFSIWWVGHNRPCPSQQILGKGICRQTQHWPWIF